MEPVEPGTIFGALMGAIADLNEPSPKYVDINTNAPAEYRPLRFALPSAVYDVHPSQIIELSHEITPYGVQAIHLSFQPNVAKWIANITSAHIGEKMTLSVCGKVVAAPIIREALATGMMQITGGDSISDINHLTPIIAGQLDCDSAPMADYVQKPPTPGRKTRGN